MRGRFGEYTLDTATRELIRDGETLHLSPKGFDLLRMLIEARPRALSKEEILEKVWAGTFVSDGTLTVIVAEVRAVLGDDPRNPRFIRTVQRFGYAFCGDLDLLPEESDAIPPAFRLLWGDREIALTAGRNVLGRCREAVAWIDDPSISRRHAAVDISGATATIQDLGSKNGTFLSGRRIQERHVLNDGDEIMVGRVPMVFRILRDGASTASVHSATP